MRRSFLGLILGFAAASTVACSANDSSSGIDHQAPADDQAEEDLTNGVTRFGTKLEDPGSLTSFGDNVYFATTYGYATEEEASYNHDIWVKPKSGGAKRLYKGLYGATWGMSATKNGIYEINEGYASVLRYPIDGSNKDGVSIYHSIYGNDNMPEVGIVSLAADDDGLVLGLRSSDDNNAAGSVVALTPAGKNEKKLGDVPGGATALRIDGANVYVGTRTGDVLVAARDGSGSLKKVASGDGSVASITLNGGDVFFGTDKGIFVKRAAAAATAPAEMLLAEGGDNLTVLRDRLVFGEWQKGVFTMPLAGGATKLALKITGPSSILLSNDYVFVTDKAYGKCTNTEDGQACAFDGSAFRLKL